MYKLISASLLLLHTLSPLSAQTGKWTIALGQVPGGNTYSGTVNIAKSSKTFTLDWKTTAGDYSGVGLQIDGRLFAGYGVGPEGYGIAVYKPAGRNQMEALWTASGMSGSVSTETIKGSNGRFTVDGKTPAGDSYTGLLTLQETGNTYQAQWTIGETVYNGIGFKSGDLLVIGYGYGQAFGVVEYNFGKDGANGRWAMGGGEKLGVENLKK